MTAPDRMPPGSVHPKFAGNDDTLVSKARWNELAQMRAIVGQCRSCGGDVQPIASEAHDTSGEIGAVTWYEARCSGCGKEIAAPNGRVMRRSMMHQETPRGWLETREARDRDDAKARQTGRPE